MLGKFFKKNEPTENIGKLSENQQLSQDLPKAAYITIRSSGNEICKAIAPKLTIGSEVGDLILTDEGVSPRHCTLLLSKDIISIIDHSSEEGTFLNKKRLDPGRTFIIGSDDTIRIGPVAAYIEFKSVPEAFAEGEPNEEGEDAQDSVEDEHFEAPQVAKTETLSLEQTKDLELDQFQEEDQEDDQEVSQDDTQAHRQRRENKHGKDFTMVSSKGLELKGQTKIEVNIGGKVRKNLMTKESDKEGDDSSQGKKSFLQKLMFWKGSGKPKKIKAGKKNKKVKMIKKSKEPATSGILRLVALSLDGLFSLSLHTLLGPIAIYSEFFVAIPGTLEKFIVPFYKEFIAVHLEGLIKSDNFIAEGISSVGKYEDFDTVLGLLCLTIAFRVFSALILKVSMAQFLIGIRDKQSSFIVGRLKGPLREILGIFTFPFIVFDLPALLNKRTLKEMLSFSRLQTPFPLASSMLIIIWVPISMLIYLASPVFEGLEIKPAVHVDTVSERAVKPWTYEKPSKTEVLDMMYDTTKRLVALPQFEIQIKDGKKYRKKGLKFFDLETGASLEILKEKENFKLIKILDNYISENPLAEHYQPKIQSLVRSAALNSKNFKHKIQKSELLAFSTELRNLVKSTYTLSLENLLDFMINQGIFFKGHMKFRRDFSSLFEGKIKEITFTNFGNVSGLFFTLDSGRGNTYNYLPLTSTSPALFKVSENITSMRLAAITKSIRVAPEADTESVDAASMYIDNISQGKSAQKLQQIDRILAERFSQLAKRFLEKGWPLIEIENLISRNLNSLQIDKRENSLLYRKLNEILNKLNLKDYKYFGLKVPKESNE